MSYLPNDKWMKEILAQSSTTWKPEHIEALMAEECSELNIELVRSIGRPARKDKKKIQEELADVLITAWELAYHYNDDGEVEAWVRKKLQREKERMDDPNYGVEEKL